MRRAVFSDRTPQPFHLRQITLNDKRRTSVRKDDYGVRPERPLNRQNQSSLIPILGAFNEQLIGRCTVSSSLLFAALQPPCYSARHLLKRTAMHDQHFDDLAIRVLQKIYGSNKGAIRLAVLQTDLNEVLPQRPLQVLDIGAGLGHMAFMAGTAKRASGRFC